MNKENHYKKFVLSIQVILTVCGTILAGVMLYRELKAPTLLGILGSVTHLITYLAIIFYSLKTYQKENNIYFQGVIYAYAAVMGIQILQAGNFISDFGLTPNVALFINCCNLICFANIIKFADFLNSKKIALSYMTIAVILKLMIEICLIAKMFTFIQLIHILTSLSIPILGITIIVAYIYRMDRMK